MAVVKANFVKRDKYERNKGKAHVRYIQHRQGKDGERIIRTFFGNDGPMERPEAYRIVDEAGKRFSASLSVRIQMERIRIGIWICAKLRRELCLKLRK